MKDVLRGMLMGYDNDLGSRYLYTLNPMRALHGRVLMSVQVFKRSLCNFSKIWYIDSTLRRRKFIPAETLLFAMPAPAPHPPNTRLICLLETHKHTKNGGSAKMNILASSTILNRHVAVSSLLRLANVFSPSNRGFAQLA